MHAPRFIGLSLVLLASIGVAQDLSDAEAVSSAEEPRASQDEPESPDAREPVRFQPWSGAIDPETGRPAVVAPEPPREPEPSLLFPGRIVHGGYGGPTVRFTRVLSEPAALVGVQGGWLIDHAWVVGLAAYGLASRHDAPEAMRVNGEPSRMELAYGGVRLGYLLQPHRLLHLGASVLVGPGGVVSVARRDDLSDDDRVDHGDVLVAVEPELEGELNVVRFMRVTLSASYRYLGAVDAPGLSSRKLSAPAGGITLRFGKF